MDCFMMVEIHEPGYEGKYCRAWGMCNVTDKHDEEYIAKYPVVPK
jgi:hypothetical protein